MTYTNNNGLKKTIFNVIKLQLIQGVIAVVVVTLYMKSFVGFYSGFLGLLIAVIPTLVYAKVVVTKKIDNANIMYGKHKKAMAVKFIINGVGFFIVFLNFKNISVFSLFTVYVIAISGYWTSLISSVKTK